MRRALRSPYPFPPPATATLSLTPPASNLAPASTLARAPALALAHTPTLTRCGGLSFRLEATLGSAEEAAAACNVTRDALEFAAVWVAPWKRGGPFALPKASATPPADARRQWHVDEGVRVCRERFTPVSASADLVGVARSNQTSSARGEELCLTILSTGNV